MKKNYGHIEFTKAEFGRWEVKDLMYNMVLGKCDDALFFPCKDVISFSIKDLKAFCKFM